MLKVKVKLKKPIVRQCRENLCQSTYHYVDFNVAWRRHELY